MRNICVYTPPPVLYDQALCNNHKQPLNLMLQACFLSLCFCTSVLYLPTSLLSALQSQGIVSSYLQKSTYHILEPCANK